MAVATFKGNFCNVQDFTPTARTTSAVEEMNHIIKMSSLLEKILMSVPAFQIFAGRNTYTSFTLGSTAFNIKTYDWQQFAQAIKSVDAVRRARLEEVAYNAASTSMGKEKEFWTCVYNAL